MKYIPMDYDPEDPDLLRPLTQTEEKALRSLDRLAKTWPKSLKLLSMGGTLHVVLTEDDRLHTESPDRADAVVATVHGISNDGGDW